MKPWDYKSLLRTLGWSALLWLIVAILCLFVGSSGMIGIPQHQDGEVIWAILARRVVIVLLASLVGAALAAAGVAYQAILQNPLADPYLLGVSSGATLMAYLWQLPAVTFALALGQQGFAFLGAILAVGIVFLAASRRGRLEPITMLLVGVIVNAMNASIFLLLTSIYKDPARSGGAISFLVGGLDRTYVSNMQIFISALIVAVGWIILLALSGQLNVALLSEPEAAALGVRVNRLRWIVMLTASLITAAAVALSGPIGFVGLICPHLARLFVGNDQRRLLPLATALGAALLAVADAAARWLASRRGIDTVLPVGVLTGLLGGPFFLMLLWRSRRALNL